MSLSAKLARRCELLFALFGFYCAKIALDRGALRADSNSPLAPLSISQPNRHADCFRKSRIGHAGVFP